jgi:threonine/homoserine/homoserine lactone efflux protein
MVAEISTFAKAIGLGLTIAAPVGPIGLICIRQSLTSGVKCGLQVGLGAALADAFYATVAGFGLFCIQANGNLFTHTLQLLGSLFLIYLGIMEWRSKPVSLNSPSSEKTASGSKSLFLKIFLLTLANPMTIGMFWGIFSSLGPQVTTTTSKIILTLGIFCGSMLWWLILSASVSATRHCISPSLQSTIAKITAAILIGLGAWGAIRIIPLMFPQA